MKSVLQKLQRNYELSIAWFEMSYTKLNTYKCHLLILGNKNEYTWEKLHKILSWKIMMWSFLGLR